VDDGTVVDSYDADLALPPASVAKALTALYALEFLGADHRFVTRLSLRGPSPRGGSTGT
jgi:D-alanyl-D-alanine carboxypeptidase/D-alanyl-D-alanine-endopeptidase (penicillin-binding protein 4)